MEEDIFDQFRDRKKSLIDSMQNNIDIIDRMASIAAEGSSVIDNIDDQFCKVTKLDKVDMAFLFFAVALQVGRILLQPKLDFNFEKIDREDRDDATASGKNEKKICGQDAEDNKTDNVKSEKYPDNVTMFLYPVPYDAMKGTERIIIPGVSPFGKQITGANHHSVTMGHDPVLGYLFGPVNILTRTISFKNPTIQTSKVGVTEQTLSDILRESDPAKRVAFSKIHSGQYVTEKDISKKDLINEISETVSEDKKRITLSVARHALHIQSDKYCRDGLPIPFISPELAQKLIDMDWNSVELERLLKLIGKNMSTIGKQEMISAVINAIIEQIHKLCYKPECGLSYDLYCVKTHKIIVTSNVIASSSNILAVALGCFIGVETGNVKMIKDSANMADIGGIIETVHRLVKDQKFIYEVKREYLRNEWDDYVEQRLKENY